MKLPFDFTACKENLKFYPDSVQKAGDGWVFMASNGTEDYLYTTGEAVNEFEGEPCCRNSGHNWSKIPLTSRNAIVLRRLFSFTAPMRVLVKDQSIGCGDRLGNATPGHIRAVTPYDAYPVLAQQSMRELSLTGRTYASVLNDVSFAVFKTGFTRGFGADGDHLKNADDIKHVIDLGYTMVTLDLSDYINQAADSMSDTDVLSMVKLPLEVESNYLDKTFNLEDSLDITFTKAQLARTYIKYNKAIDFGYQIYTDLIAPAKDRVDFEISLDETAYPTLLLEHFYVASEFIRRGVKFETVAPRFCGEFQKGIDYIGNIAQFEAELDTHAAIAKHFGYKLSIHSGSDKFSVFGIIGRGTHGKYHVKTAGTSWLEAMRIIAKNEPAFYRELHQHALKSFSEATKLYVVTTDLEKIPNIDTLKDDELAGLFNQNETRQLIHITYGQILSDKNPDGSYMFRDKLYKLWREHADDYAKMLEKHIGRHLHELNVESS